MKDLKKNIQDKRQAFDSREPNPGHFDRFEEKLDAYHAEGESWFEKHGFALRIAATILIFVALGAFLYTGLYDRVKGVLSDRIVAAELPDEVVEVMQYYNVITDSKVEQIDELAVSQDEAERVKQMALLELKALDEFRTELEKEYAKQPDNKRILNALLQNQQQREKILDRILNTMNQVK